jgi:hypothetical protein
LFLIVENKNAVHGVPFKGAGLPRRFSPFGGNVSLGKVAKRFDVTGTDA